MKLPRTFFVTFGIAMVSLLISALWPSAFALAWAYSFGLMYVGGFAALMIVVAIDLSRSRKALGPRTLLGRLRLITSGQVITLGVIGAILFLTFRYDIFPFFWNVVAAAVLGLCLAWRFLSDYGEIFHSRPMPAGPTGWQALEAGRIPQATLADIERSKVHLSKSCEVHGQCIPRTSHYGLISLPLKLDE
jgi:hypothetical protein